MIYDNTITVARESTFAASHKSTKTTTIQEIEELTNMDFTTQETSQLSPFIDMNDKQNTGQVEGSNQR